MSAEKKTAAWRYRPWADPNLPFALAVVTIILYAFLTLKERVLLYAPEGCIFWGICFIILRYARSGWWRLLRAIVICMLLLGFGSRLVGFDPYPSSDYDLFFFPAMFVLSLWLYLL